MCRGSFVVLSLDLETTMHADVNLVCYDLLKLVEDQFEGNDGKKNCCI
jgi:hypothetical protein